VTEPTGGGGDVPQMGTTTLVLEGLGLGLGLGFELGLVSA
jgi:hypothetical protein